MSAAAVAPEQPAAAADSGSARLGFGRECRLLKAENFAAVFSARRALKSENFLLFQCDNGGIGVRLGLVVGKRHLKAAARRNLVKRLAREVFRLRRPALPSRDLVLRLARTPADLDKDGLRRELESLFGRLIP